MGAAAAPEGCAPAAPEGCVPAALEGCVPAAPEGRVAASGSPGPSFRLPHWPPSPLARTAGQAHAHPARRRDVHLSYPVWRGQLRGGGRLLRPNQPIHDRSLQAGAGRRAGALLCRLPTARRPPACKVPPWLASPELNSCWELGCGSRFLTAGPRWRRTARKPLTGPRWRPSRRQAALATPAAPSAAPLPAKPRWTLLLQPCLPLARCKRMFPCFFHLALLPGPRRQRPDHAARQPHAGDGR